MTRTRLALSAFALALASSLAFGQNADPNTAGPTKNDYRLRVVEPAEGATITGGTVRVVVNTSVRQQLGDQEKTDSNSMPRPLVDIFLDDKLQGTLKDENNVLSVDAVTPGAHKLVVLAKNLSGEIIDRKEIKFNTVVATADTSTSTMTRSTTEETRVQSAPPPPAPAPVAPPPPAPRPQTYAPPPAPAPAPVAIAETRSNELPSTGTSDLAIAGAGLALLVGGLALRRRA